MNHKEFMESVVSEKAGLICSLSDQVFDFAELGYQEFKTAELYVKLLEQEGFQVESGIDGIPTAFRASFGSGKPVIGYLAEYDALPALSQKADSPKREKADQESPDGHGCGHNLLGAGCFAAALAIKAYLERNPGKGTVILFGCPSEEKGNSKTFLARDGYFDCLDIAYSWHPFDRNGPMTYSTLASVSILFHFKGITAHAAAVPHMGRSALDAAELMNVGVNYLREHVIPEARIHYAYRDVGGIAPNVVQGSSCVHYFVRAPKNSQVKEILARVIDVAEGAAKMTGTEMRYEMLAGLSDFIPNQVVTQNVWEALHEFGLPQFDEADKAYAHDFFYQCDEGENLQRKIDAIHQKYGEAAQEKLAFPMNTEIPELDWRKPILMGSTDVGDASYVVPMALLEMATCTLGTDTHTWQMTAQGKSAIAHKAMLQAGKVMALSAARFYENPELVEKAKAELKRTTGGEYICPIPKQLPPPLEE